MDSVITSLKVLLNNTISPEKVNEHSKHSSHHEISRK